MSAMKRLVLLLDGTWNDAEFGNRDTNIVRLRELLAKTLHADLSLTQTYADGALVTSRKYDDQIDYLVFYARGVGTSAFDRLRGGTFGVGLSRNIRRAYRQLCFYYEPGDEIFVFGFSRGAYTARSLIGMIGSAGLLKCEHCTPELELKAWDFYRTAPGDRLPGNWAALTRYVHDRKQVQIACLGVFDTVGALGIPLPQFQLVNRDRYEFHNVELSSNVKVNLHALAIDEHRVPFQAAVWRKPKFKVYNSITEQVWFPGAHADIGGGYIPDQERMELPGSALDDVSLEWMIRRIKHHYPSMPLAIPDWGPAAGHPAQHNSRSSIYRAFPLGLRSIANYPVNLGRRQTCVSRDRHSDPTGEAVHLASIERLGCEVDVSGTRRKYSPANLTSVLQTIQGTYKGALSQGEHQIPIVDWSGDLLDPREAEARERATDLLRRAEDRLRLS
jgi:Uncharacterized alpha/beta hydrolase domain (DUF2235)